MRSMRVVARRPGSSFGPNVAVAKSSAPRERQSSEFITVLRCRIYRSMQSLYRNYGCTAAVGMRCHVERPEGGCGVRSRGAEMRRSEAEGRSPQAIAKRRASARGSHNRRS